MKSAVSEKGVKERTHLKRIRQMAGYTQQEVADKLGVTKATISKYENGTRKINHAEELAELYGVDLSYIYLGKNMQELRADLAKNRIEKKSNALPQSSVGLDVQKYLEFTIANPDLMKSIELIGVRIFFDNVSAGKLAICNEESSKEVDLSSFVEDLKKMQSEQRKNLMELFSSYYGLVFGELED